MKDKAKKQEEVARLHKELEKSKSVFAASFQGIKVKEDYELRKQVRAAGGTYRVVANRLARIESDSRDGARKIGADSDTVHGLNGANNGHRCRPLFLSSDNARDGFRRHLKRRGSRHRRLNLPKLHETQGREEHQHHAQRQNHSSGHGFLLQSDNFYGLPLVNCVTCRTLIHLFIRFSLGTKGF